MQDVIVFCPDTAALVSALREKYPARLNEEDPDNPIFLVDKTPTKRNEAETLALVRCRDGDRGEPNTLAMLRELETLGVLRVLGTWDAVKANKEAKAIYNRVYPRKKVSYKDEKGKTQYHTPPEEIGRFA